MIVTGHRGLLLHGPADRLAHELVVVLARVDALVRVGVHGHLDPERPAHVVELGDEGGGIGKEGLVPRV